MTLPRQVPWGLIVALVILTAVEFGVARQEWFWKGIPRTEVGVVDAIETHVIDKARDPRIILLGNSRMRDAVAPRLLEHDLGIPAGTVLNLGLTAGQPIDSLIIYRRNRGKLSRAQILVVAVEPHQFNRRIGLTDRVQRFTSLAERLEIFDGRPECISSVVGYSWRTYGVGRSMGRWAVSPLFPITRTLPIGDDGRLEWRPADAGVLTDEEDQVEARVKRQYDQRDPSSMNKMQLFRLIKMARADGVKVVAIVVPVRNSVSNLVRQRYAEAYEYCLREVEEVGQSADLLLVHDRAVDLGLRDEQFYDFGHMMPPATAIMTRRLADELQEAFPQLLSRDP